MSCQVNARHRTGPTATFSVSAAALCLLAAWLITPTATARAKEKKFPDPPKTPTDRWSGGEAILTDNYELTETWTTASGELMKKGLYWTGGWYLDPKKRQYVKWDSTVRDQVAPLVGTLTLQGPGKLLVKRDSRGARLVLRDANTGAMVAHTQCGSDAWGNSWRPVWSGGYPRDKGDQTIDVARLPYGILKGKEIVIDVYVNATPYNNTMNTGEFSYHAPQTLDFEIWWFPLEGGKALKVTKKDKDGKDVDVIVDGKRVNNKPDVPDVPDNIDWTFTPTDDFDPLANTTEPPRIEPEFSGLQAGNVTDDAPPPIDYKDKYQKLLDAGLSWEIVQRIAKEDEIAKLAWDAKIDTLMGNIWGACELGCIGLKAAGETSNYIIGMVAEFDKTGTLQIAAPILDGLYAWTGSRENRYEREGDLALFDLGDDGRSVMLKVAENAAFAKLKKAYGIQGFNFTNYSANFLKMVADRESIDKKISSAHQANVIYTAAFFDAKGRRYVCGGKPME